MQASITFVSRRWHHVFYSEPALWRSLYLTAYSLYDAHEDGQAQQWFAARADLLRRVGGFVQQLSHVYEPAPDVDEYLDVEQVAAASSTDWQLSSCALVHLSPAALQSLRLEWTAVDAAAAPLLQRLTSLKELNFEYCGELPSCVLAALPGLPQLLSLELRCPDCPIDAAALGTALPHLTQLTSLTCETCGTLPDLSAVLPLTRLRQLDWEEERRTGLLVVDLPQLLGRLPQLESWRLKSVRTGRSPGTMQVGMQ